MHAKRVLTALLFLPLFYALVAWGPVWAFGAFVALAGLLCMREFFAMLAAMNLAPAKTWSLIVFLGILLSMPFRWGAEAAFLLIVAAPLWQVAAFASCGKTEPAERRAHWLGFVSGTVLALWLAVGLGCQVMLRADPRRGAMLVFALYLASMAGDSAAYYIGRAFGRHAMAPAISPKKTWEGSAAHVLASVAALLAAGWFFLPEMTWPHALAMGAAMSVLGQAGDLAVSLLKRAAETKDSGGILPGHGGLLDRADALIPSAPLLYAWWHWMMR